MRCEVPCEVRCEVHCEVRCKVFFEVETVAEWSWRVYPAPLGADGVGSIPANPDALNVPSFRRRRFEMKLSPFFLLLSGHLLFLER